MLSKEDHRLSVDSSCDIDNNENERDPAAYCDFDMGRFRYSRQSHSRPIYDDVHSSKDCIHGLNDNENDVDNNNKKDIEMDLSHISHAASESDRSEDIPLTMSTQDRYTTNAKNHNDISSTLDSFHLDLEQQLRQHYDSDNYDVRDQERCLEASLTGFETSGEVDDLNVTNNSNNHSDNTNQYPQRGNNNYFASASSVELDDEVLMHLAARSHTLYQQQQQRPQLSPSSSHTQEEREAELKLVSKQQEKGCEIDNNSDSDSDIDIAGDPLEPVSASKAEDHIRMHQSRGFGSGYASIEKRDKDELLDSRVFGADWHLDFGFQKVSLSGRVNSGRDLEMERGDRDYANVDKHAETDTGLPYDPIAAAEAMAERMDKELDKDMVFVEEEHNAKYDHNNQNHMKNHDLYDIQESSMSTSNIWDRTDMELTSPASVASGSPLEAIELSGMSLNQHQHQFQTSPSYSSFSKESFGANVHGISSNIDNNSNRPKTSSGSNFGSLQPTRNSGRKNQRQRPMSATNKDDLLDTPALDICGLKIMKDIESRVHKKQSNVPVDVQDEFLKEKQTLSILSSTHDDSDSNDINSPRLSPTRMSRNTGLNTLSDIEKVLQQEENDFLMEYGDLSL